MGSDSHKQADSYRFRWHLGFVWRWVAQTNPLYPVRVSAQQKIVTALYHLTYRSWCLEPRSSPSRDCHSPHYILQTCNVEQWARPSRDTLHRGIFQASQLGRIWISSNTMPRIDPSSSIATRGCLDRELDPPPEESCVSPASFFRTNSWTIWPYRS